MTSKTKAKLKFYSKTELNFSANVIFQTDNFL